MDGYLDFIVIYQDMDVWSRKSGLLFDYDWVA